MRSFKNGQTVTKKPNGLSRTYPAKSRHRSGPWGSIGYVATAVDGGDRQRRGDQSISSNSLGAVYQCERQLRDENQKNRGPPYDKLKDNDGRFLWSGAAFPPAKPARACFGYPCLIRRGHAGTSPAVADASPRTKISPRAQSTVAKPGPDLRVLARSPYPPPKCPTCSILQATKAGGGDVSDFAAIRCSFAVS